jgi:hypothetical protein
VLFPSGFPTNIPLITKEKREKRSGTDVAKECDITHDLCGALQWFLYPLHDCQATKYHSSNLFMHYKTEYFCLATDSTTEKRKATVEVI